MAAWFYPLFNVVVTFCGHSPPCDNDFAAFPRHSHLETMSLLTCLSRSTEDLSWDSLPGAARITPTFISGRVQVLVPFLTHSPSSEPPSQRHSASRGRQRRTLRSLTLSSSLRWVRHTDLQGSTGTRDTHVPRPVESLNAHTRFVRCRTAQNAWSPERRLQPHLSEHQP